MIHVIDAMAALYISQAEHGEGQVIAGPRPTDAIGAVLRGVFGDGAVPRDMVLLLQRLDRVH